MTCTECKEDLPEELVSNLSTMRGNRLVCACCALTLIRRETHAPWFTFQSPTAQAWLRQCLDIKAERKLARA